MIKKNHYPFLILLILLVCIFSFSPQRIPKAMEGDIMNDSQNQFGMHKSTRMPQYKGVTNQSLYITMRDDVKIAVDVILPKDLPSDVKLPTIMTMARYWRSFQLRMPARRGKAPMGPRVPIVDFLADYGYAVVIVDARGSGASFGTWHYLWSQDEIEDYGEVATWITKQPWSNGTIGGLGISYEGTTAELLSVAHPAKAVIPRQMEFDLYPDIVFPGGILNDVFIKGWQHTNLHLDSDRVPKEWGWSARLFVKGVRPVDDDKKKTQLKQAVAAHRDNPDVYKAAKNITYRDDLFGSSGMTLDDMSVFNFKEEIEGSNAAISGWGSWLDGTTSDTVIRRFVNFSNPQYSVIGAWIHTGEKHASPYLKPKSPPVPDQKSQWQEILRFLDHHLRGIQDEHWSEKVLFYYTMGEEKWKSTEVWPPAGTTTQRWYLNNNHTLSQEPPSMESGADTYTIDFEATTGTKNRWHTQDGVTPVIYKDRSICIRV